MIVKQRKIEKGWTSYLELNERLLKAVAESGFEPDYVAFISKGGLIPGQWISERMRLPYVIIAAEHWPDGKKAGDVKIARHSLYVTKMPPFGKILIVDDLTDTGLTLRRAREYMLRKFRKGFWRNLWRRIRRREPYRGITETKAAVLWFKEVEEPLEVPDYSVEAVGIDPELDPDGLMAWIDQPIERPGLFWEDSSRLDDMEVEEEAA